MSNSGWGGVFKNTHRKTVFNSNNGASQTNNSFPPSLISFATVVAVNLDPGPSLGLITYEINGRDYQALPLFPSLKTYPVSGELVLLINAASARGTSLQNTKPNFLNQTNAVFYISSLNIWNNPSFNGVNPSTLVFPYEKVESIKPLQFMPGDVNLEGRYGNAIRLGSTNTFINNDWSSNGENGDPITIISNGQSNLSPVNNLSFVENLNSTLSSLYLTSYQQIANFKIANNSFQSYDKKPEYADQYKSPQIILNSTRVILNANQDSVLISGEKSVGLSSNQSINFESSKIYMSGTDIRLGAKNASEPVLLGNKTVDKLVDMANAIKQISKVVSTLKTYNGGVPAPDPSNTVGFELIEDMQNIINTLENKTHGIRSNFVKTR